jgi:hypothetical protein
MSQANVTAVIPRKPNLWPSGEQNEKVGLPKTDHARPLRESETLLEAFFDLSPDKSVLEFN